jgi:L-threonylcarbamoyladenylate synthase
MEIIKLNTKNEDKVIEEAVMCLRKGGILLYPTDTCYGLAADIFNETAFRKLYQLKDMSYVKPISITVSSLNEAKKYGQFLDLASDVAKEFWPGPLTIIANKKSSLPNFLNIGVETIGLRVVDYPFVRKLVEAYGLPLTTTSANISGKKECYSIADFKKQFKGRLLVPDLAIDAGRLSKNSPSTVVEITGDVLRFIREGTLSKKLQKYVKERN